MTMIANTFENKKFNFRVGAFVFDKSNNYVLLHRKINSNYWMLPGGRVEYVESTDEAISRELKEELGLNISGQLTLITENFFDNGNLKTHEIDFDFLCNYNEVISNEFEFSGLEGKYLIFKWVRKENIDNYNLIVQSEKDFIKDYINCGCNEIKKKVLKAGEW